MPPKKRMRISASPTKKSAGSTVTKPEIAETTSETTNKNHFQASGELQYLLSEAIVNVDVTIETILENIPGVISRVVPFEDWTVCLNHPKPPFCRKVRIRRSRYGQHSDPSTMSSPSSVINFHPYKWEVLEVRRKRQHSNSKSNSKGGSTKTVNPAKYGIHQETITSCECSHNAQTFFESIGHTYDREFIRHGKTATVELVNGQIEIKLFYVYKTLNDAMNNVNQSPMLLEISASVQKFKDQIKTRYELCIDEIKNIINHLFKYITVVHIPPGKKEYEILGGRR
jgi:hypothetical protein